MQPDLDRGKPPRFSMDILFQTVPDALPVFEHKTGLNFRTKFMWTGANDSKTQNVHSIVLSSTLYSGGSQPELRVP